MREHLGVGQSLKVEAKETADGILLKPVPPASSLMMKGGLLIFKGSGEGTDQIAWDSLIEEDREERIRKIAGM